MLSGSEALSQEAWPNPTTKILVDSDTNLNIWSALSQCQSVEQLRYEAAQLILEIERVISVQLSEILDFNDFSNGEYEFDIFTVKVNRVKHYDSTLINL